MPKQEPVPSSSTPPLQRLIDLIARRIAEHLFSKHASSPPENQTQADQQGDQDSPRSRNEDPTR